MPTPDGGLDGLARLQAKGVRIPHAASVYVAPEVDLDLISGSGVVLHPGTRIEGASTVISAGCELSGEGPATVVNCQLGRGVELKGGYFAKSVFLAGANLGLGAHVREGSILEEQAGGAHCVGLKQTILFPFVTLGSLINFCDALMAGGTSRKDHSEVGSSYIHFNFTPDGTKTTASLFGDVPRGVMLDQPRIFLGGQGGAVGPVRTGFGTIVGAGSVLRGDIAEDGMLVIDPGPGAIRRPASGRNYRGLSRIVERNLTYLANLHALQAWYEHVRQPFFAADELGMALYQGALRALAAGQKERATRLSALAGLLPPSEDAGRAQFSERIADVLQAYQAAPIEPDTAFLTALASHRVDDDYLATIKALPPQVRAAGVAWLQSVVDDLTARAAAVVPELKLYCAA